MWSYDNEDEWTTTATYGNRESGTADSSYRFGTYRLTFIEEVQTLKTEINWQRIELWNRMRDLWRVCRCRKETVRVIVHRKTALIRKMIFSLSGWVARKGRKLRNGK